MHAFLGEWCAACDRNAAEDRHWELRQEVQVGLGCRASNDKWSHPRASVQEMLWSDPCRPFTPPSLKMKCLSRQTIMTRCQASFLPHVCLFFLQFIHCPVSILYVVPTSWPFISQSKVNTTWGNCFCLALICLDSYKIHLKPYFSVSLAPTKGWENWEVKWNCRSDWSQSVWVLGLNFLSVITYSD